MRRFALTALFLVGCNLTPAQVASDVITGVDVGVCIIAHIVSQTDPFSCLASVPNAGDKEIVEAIDHYTSEADAGAIPADHAKLLQDARFRAVTRLASKASGK